MEVNANRTMSGNGGTTIDRKPGGVTQSVPTQTGGGIAPPSSGDGLGNASEPHGGALEVTQDGDRDVAERLNVGEHARKELLVESVLGVAVARVQVHVVNVHDRQGQGHGGVLNATKCHELLQFTREGLNTTDVERLGGHRHEATFGPRAGNGGARDGEKLEGFVIQLGRADCIESRRVILLDQGHFLQAGEVSLLQEEDDFITVSMKGSDVGNLQHEDFRRLGDASRG
eukprot:5242019-Heterocapsa_arctica.AAC.1